jgi:hypothetical protein
MDWPITMAVSSITGLVKCWRDSRRCLPLTILTASKTEAVHLIDPNGLGFSFWRLTSNSVDLCCNEGKHQERPRLLLIAGRSGTGDDLAQLSANVRAMEAYALRLYRVGHLPVVDEWLALSLVALAGSK